MAFDAEAAIDSFWQAAQRGEHFPREWYNQLALDDAYHVQLGLIARRCAIGERQIGWKVGLTAPAIQHQFGFYEPIFGCILDRTDSGRIFRPEELVKPGFESELCFRLSQDIPGIVTPEDVRKPIDRVFPALEITEMRGPVAEQMPLTIADNAQQKTIVLGPGVALRDDLALDRVEMRAEINGNIVATGRGDAVLGNPVNSVVWLAGKLPTYNRMLKAGELIMSGSFIRNFPIAPGDRVRVEFSSVGVVETSMSY